MGRTINYLNTQKSIHQNSFTTHYVVPSLSPLLHVSSYVTLTMHTVILSYHTENGRFIAQKAYNQGATHDNCTVKGNNKREARYYITTAFYVPLHQLLLSSNLSCNDIHTHTHSIWKPETSSNQVCEGIGDCCFKVEIAPRINKCAMPLC